MSNDRNQAQIQIDINDIRRYMIFIVVVLALIFVNLIAFDAFVAYVIVKLGDALNDIQNSTPT